MHDLWKELERACERSTKELKDFNDRLETNKNMMSPGDLDILFKLMDIVKDIKSTMKKIIEIEDMEMDQNEYDEKYSGTYYRQPMWDRKYSGNSYRGTYTVESGDGYSGRRSTRHMYSRDTEQDRMHNELNNMLNEARDPQEAETIRKLMNRL